MAAALGAGRVVALLLLMAAAVNGMLLLMASCLQALIRLRCRPKPRLSMEKLNTACKTGCFFAITCALPGHVPQPDKMPS